MRRGSPVPPLPPRKAVVSISAPQRILDSSERILGRTEGALQWPAKGTARDRPGRSGLGPEVTGESQHPAEAQQGGEVTEAEPRGWQGAGVTHRSEHNAAIH